MLLVPTPSLHALDVRLLRAEGEHIPDHAAWDALASSVAEPNPFFERWYLKPALDQLAEGRSVWLAQGWLASALVV